MQQEKKRYPAIDVAKFICAILVVMIHIPPFGKREPSVAAHFLNLVFQGYFSKIAVPFFFAASGFFVFSKDREDAYVRKYIGKIFRIYLIWTVIYFPFSFPPLMSRYGSAGKALCEYFRLFILNGSYDHLWYLPALILAVVLVAVLLHKNISPKVILVISSVFFVLGLTGQTWYGLLIPLKTSCPQFYQGLVHFHDLIGTTRDGLFEAFFFVSSGCLLARTDIRIRKSESVMLFFISMLMLVLEVYLTFKLGWVYRTDMYLFLAPAATFGLLSLSRIEMKERPVYKDLRAVSSLIFYMHPLCYIMALEILKRISSDLALSAAAFWSTLILTVICAIIIEKLAQRPKLSLLKKLYS